MAIEELHVRITGDSGDLTAALTQVRAATEVTEEGLDDLQAEAEQAGDEMTSLSARSATASASLLGMGSAASLASVNISALSSTLGGVVAQAGAALAILPGLTAALGGAGVAAGGVALGGGITLGLGAAAAGAEQLKTDLQIIKENILAISEAAGEQLGLGEMLRTGIRALDDLAAETLSRIMDDLPAFASALREFGSAAANAIPGLVESLVKLGRMALPVLTDGLRWLQTNGPQIFNTLVNAARRLGPELITLAQNIADIIGFFTEASVVFLEDFLPALNSAIDAIGRIGSGVDLAIDALASLFTFLATGQFSDHVADVGQRLGQVFGTRMANAIIALINQNVFDELNRQIAAQMQGVSPEEIGFGLDPIPRVPSVDTGGPVAGGGGDFALSKSEQAALEFKRMFNSVVNNTAKTAENTAATAAATESAAQSTAVAAKGATGTMQTLRDSALNQGPCDLREALLGPLERAPLPRPQAIGRGLRLRDDPTKAPTVPESGRLPRGEGLTPGREPATPLAQQLTEAEIEAAVESGVRQAIDRSRGGDEPLTIKADGKKIAELTQKHQRAIAERHITE